MSDTPPPAAARISLRIGGRRLDVEIEVPAGPARPAALVPFALAVAEASADVAAQESFAEGRPVSCRKGCGACCRQLVPVAEPEARYVADLVARLPEPRRSAVLARFDEVRRRLADEGLLDRMMAASDLATHEERRALGLRYFALGVPCPFLEDESCSIHEERPSACREYLVTSPAAECARPSGETVHRVDVSTKVSRALIGLGSGAAPGQGAWLPLSLALAWCEAHPEPAPGRTGRELLEEFLAALRRK